LQGKQSRKTLPKSQPFDHEIKLKEGFIPWNCKIYPLNPKETERMKEFIKDNLTNGFIKPLKSPQVSPFFFVGKKEAGEFIPCQDYCYLNEWMIKTSYPLLLVPELLDSIGDVKIFTKLDIRWGYNNILIKPADTWKAAFKCTEGLFEPVVVFFGLTNGPATFQAFMEWVFANFILEGWFKVFINNLLIMSLLTWEHKEREIKVLTRLAEHDLLLKLEKCVFAQKQVEYLGFIISEKSVSMDPKKIRGITEWEILRTVKEVRSFLGFANFYRKFIDHYSKKARPLHDLTKKDTHWTWKKEQQDAFETVKRSFVEKVILKTPEQGKQYFMAMDASLTGTGGVLMQKDNNGDLRLLSFISSTFTLPERNYEIYDWELLAMVKGLKEWRHYLEGASHPVVAWVDHDNLMYFRNPQCLNRRQARWQMYLSRFNLQILYQSAKKEKLPYSIMLIPDTLSRRSRVDIEDNNKDQTLLPTSMFINELIIEEDLQKELA
jgi:hypothetical protein